MCSHSANVSISFPSYCCPYGFHKVRGTTVHVSIRRSRWYTQQVVRTVSCAVVVVPSSSSFEVFSILIRTSIYWYHTWNFREIARYNNGYLPEVAVIGYRTDRYSK